MALDPHINPQSGVWDDNYFAQQEQKNKYSSSSGGGSSYNPQQAIEESIKRMQEANKPIIQNLESTIPEVQAKYTQTREQLQSKQPALEERYKTLLDSIKGQGEQDINSQTRITNNELGKRGLVGSSTLAQQEIQNAVSHLRQKYTGLEKETSLSREEAIKSLQEQIANLTPQEVADKRAIQAQIASLQSGAISGGATMGQNLYAAQMQNDLAQKQFEETKRQNAIQEALQQMQTPQSSYMSLGEGSSIFDPATGRIIATAPKTYKDVQGGAGGGNPLGI